MNNTGIFIDIAKQYNSVTRSNREVKIDYKKFYEELAKDNNIHRAYAYGIQISTESESFIKVLKHIGFITKYKYAKYIKEYSIVEGNLTFVEKPSIQESNWTLGIAMDVVRNIQHLNKIIIGSNDLELAELIYWIKEHGVIVEICSRYVPKELKALADRVYDIPTNAIKISEESVELPAE